MCCKMLHIEALQKPMGVLCAHAVAKRGCAIYGRRPDACRQFECMWLSTDEMPDYWKPDRCNMLVAGDPTGTLISILVEEGYEDAWKRDPFHRDINIWARQMRWRVQVLTPKHGWVIFPEEDLFLGERDVGDSIVGFGYRPVGQMRQPVVRIRHGDGSITEVSGGTYPAP